MSLRLRRRARRLIARFSSFVDVVTVLAVDPERMLVLAAKDLTRVRREGCAGRCECCDVEFARAWASCMEWRRLQGVARQVRSSAWFVVSNLMERMER